MSGAIMTPILSQFPTSQELNADPGLTVPPQASVVRKAVDVLAMLIAFYGSQIAAIYVKPIAMFVPKSIYMAHDWIGYFDHHLVQFLFALVLIALLGRGKFSQFGLNLSNARISWRIFVVFSLVCSAVVFFVNVVPVLVSHQRPTFDYQLTPANIAGWLAFEWIFVGISEEILFRGLIQTYLSRSWRSAVTIGRVTIPTAGILTTLMFCLAHINLRHPQLDWGQQIWVFGMGIYYSTAFYRTKSLLNPILAHNFSDGLVFTVVYLLYWGMR
jgi:membrane protease YdiL (CAAX protease family)